MAYFILSLDGGGIRGVLTATALARLQQRCPFLERVDLLAGTSTGGILALGLAKGMAPSAMSDLYRQEGSRIFGARDLWDRIAGPVDEAFRADYGMEALEAALKPHFGGLTLGDLPKRVLIPTFDVDAPATEETPAQWRPKFLHNFPGPNSDGAVSVLEAALRTAAAPTYFPSRGHYIDGGVVANNPSTCAIAKAIKTGVALRDIHLLSVGTGYNPQRIPGGSGDWGKLQWATTVLQMVLEGTSGMAKYQCQQLLGDRYHRIQVELEDVIEMDDARQIDELVELGNHVDLADAHSFLSKIPRELA